MKLKLSPAATPSTAATNPSVKRRQESRVNGSLIFHKINAAEIDALGVDPVDASHDHTGKHRHDGASGFSGTFRLHRGCLKLVPLAISLARGLIITPIQLLQQNGSKARSRHTRRISLIAHVDNNRINLPSL